jgi:alpha-N-arabinofuranosidase
MKARKYTSYVLRPWMLFTTALVLGAAPVNIRIAPQQKANYTIPRTLFGTFLEPIGNSTYNGLWAEILQNPSLEENLWSATTVAHVIQEQPQLARASQLALPLPWEPLDPAEGNRYEPRWGDAANSWRSLAIFGVPGKNTGIKQQVYLPVHHELEYKGSLYAKHLSGPVELTVLLRMRGNDEVLTEANIDAADTQWHKYTFSLAVPAGKLAANEPADFGVKVQGDERVQIDQLSLLPADAVDGMDPDIVRMAKELHTPLVRFGGNFTSAYHWRDGIGPRDKRISMLNIAWGIPEYNQFGTDEFLRFCQLIGAEPQIALNLGSGTPQEAADWVSYVDDRRPTHGGLLWELGNELWGDWNLGYPTLEELPGRTRQFSEAIQRADPRARLIATGQDPDNYQSWNAAQLSNPPGTFDFLSTHFVVTTDRLQQTHADPDTVAMDGFALPVELGRRLRKMQQQINETPGYRDKAHIAFTEWLWVCCGDRKPANAPKWDNMGGAVITAGFLNMLIGNADVVPISDMTGIVEFAGIWKKRARVFGTPAYYAFQLYAGADINIPVKVSTDAGHYDVKRGVTRLPDIPEAPYLDVIAALNRSGDKLTLFCVNRHLDQDVPAEISLEDFSAQTKAAVDTLNSESIYDVNDELQPEAITPAHSSATVKNGALTYTFPRASVTRIEISRKKP